MQVFKEASIKTCVVFLQLVVCLYILLYLALSISLASYLLSVCIYIYSICCAVYLAPNHNTLKLLWKIPPNLQILQMSVSFSASIF